MASMTNASDQKSGRREKPFLFPWNRRLRHLQGISVRNLSLSAVSGSQVRARNSTDEIVEYASKSPVKLLAQKEAQSLHQTRSFTSLRSPNKDVAKAEDTSEAGKRPSSTTRGKMRRRSTLRWMGPTPETRQRKLEEMAQERLAEAWFSLHVGGIEEPVYISEICDQTVNPSFGHFDLTTSGPRVGRAGDTVLKLWVKTGKTGKFVLLLDARVEFAALQFIGKSLERFRHPLPANCVLFHFEDGIYTSLTGVQSTSNDLASWLPGKATPAKAEKTSSYGALMQLANIDDCIQDALSTRAKMEGQINALLEDHAAKIELLNQQRKTEEALNSIRLAIAAEKRQLRALTRKKEEMVASLQARKRAVEEGRATQVQSRTDRDRVRRSSDETTATSKGDLNDAKGQIRRVCEDLMTVYPLEPIKNRPLNFSIRSLYLPNSVFDDTNRDEIAAALGFASSLTHMLSLYLSTPLPYPITPAASVSTIEDPVSTGIAQRTFPLHPTNVAYKFEYGVFLLNKDIEILMDRSDLRVLDIRHTLPNLKYLIYVLTARAGEIPERKAGGIRGLLAMRSGSRSRRGSQGSQESFGSSGGIAEVMKLKDEGRLQAAQGGKRLVLNGGHIHGRGKSEA